MSKDYLFFDQYQDLVKGTDITKQEGIDGLNFSLLGLFGEVGSLLSELKKKQRDKDSYLGYVESVNEEFGDAIWYFTNTVSRAGLRVKDIANKIYSNPKDSRNNSKRVINKFSDIQIKKFHLGPLDTVQFEKGAIALAGKVGRLLDDFSAGNIKNDKTVLLAQLTEIFKAIIKAADDADIDLEEVVKDNVDKILGKFPLEPKGKRKYIPLFDEEFDIDERLPRIISIVIEEKKIKNSLYVVQKCQGIKIGDRLTDNKSEPDDYRFHDVFHLAYAAILGWSPVTRSLFKLKRKSNPQIDENEDGARAILIEEGVATWVFNHGSRLNNYDNIKSLDYSLLKAVKELVKGYEVEKCPLWQWEEAILAGFKVFRYLKQHRKGLVIADLNKRTITFKPIPVD